MIKEKIPLLILPKIKLLYTSENQAIREALAEQIMKLPTLLGKKLTTEYLIGAFLTFLKDDEIPIRIQLL